MTETPAARHHLEQQAGSLTTGTHIVLPDGGRTAEVHQVELERDDFGAPALVLASLTGGGTLRIAVGTTVTVVDGNADAVTQLPRTARPGQDSGQKAAQDAGQEQPRQLREEAATAAAAPAVVVPPLPPVPPALSGPSEEDLALIPAPQGTPESVVEAAAEAHPDAMGVLLLSDRLAKGVNFKSGSCLKDLSDLAHELFITLKDADGSLAVADLLNVLPFDGNPGRWSSVEASLALSSYICRQNGQSERAEVYEKLIRTPENQETDPFKARMAAKVRQRSLNEPNLYDKEIFRSIDNSNHDAEREWRLLRLESLLFLRAHGGSETIGMVELERRISNELEAVRA
ncbi:DUF6707 family protein [Pseudarthrobacter polychromogenes]|uniref:Uncharacterized protein n=1 Tax=Pseudarthrobacter polychromogenes TaxID=1676 RepID=A0ABQ1XQU9_9MICC|nr:DUF6707 family protein [Pseudarthrobacter polychromogenes]GGH00445.1 hypothetical protein GCM10011577_25130 [Pseudarthrobacter polychromogenes]